MTILTAWVEPGQHPNGEGKWQFVARLDFWNVKRSPFLPSRWTASGGLPRFPPTARVSAPSQTPERSNTAHAFSWKNHIAPCGRYSAKYVRNPSERPADRFLPIASRHSQFLPSFYSGRQESPSPLDDLLFVVRSPRPKARKLRKSTEGRRNARKLATSRHRLGAAGSTSFEWASRNFSLQWLSPQILRSASEFVSALRALRYGSPGTPGGITDAKR